MKPRFPLISAACQSMIQRLPPDKPWLVSAAVRQVRAKRRLPPAARKSAHSWHSSPPSSRRLLETLPRPAFAFLAALCNRLLVKQETRDQAPKGNQPQASCPAPRSSPRPPKPARVGGPRPTRASTIPPELYQRGEPGKISQANQCVRLKGLTASQFGACYGTREPASLTSASTGRRPESLHAGGVGSAHALERTNLIETSRASAAAAIK